MAFSVRHNLMTYSEAYMKKKEEGSGYINVLIIDDDRKLCQLIKDYLEPMGYQVDSANDGLTGLEMALTGNFQVIILDVMMPKMDGFDVLKKLRQKSDVPVLMLTARGDETDRIVGLEMGADDYLPKTFSTRELLARLRAVTRRYQNVEQSNKKDESEQLIVKGDLRIQHNSRMAFLDQVELSLTPLEYDLLYSMIKAEGRVLSRDQLLDTVAGRDYDVFDRSIDVHISSLRKKLGDDPKKPRFIKTVRATGYMFIYTN